MLEIHGGLVANGTILFTRHIGLHTPAAMQREILRVVQTFSNHAALPEIVDLSELTGTEMEFRSSNTVTDAILRHIEPPAPAEKKRVAIYAPSDTIYGMARVYTSLLELKNANVEAMPCRTAAEALSFHELPETCFEHLEGYDRIGPLPPETAACGL
ncbi:hypothetical protein ACN2XU_20520 [Primorskyibacter sp. 2E107]|uniref:hypothetical protein n=1 Tax=Primorskyibacter sp. 2E107 TaxID=3403458 RepID=UPI003AF6970F